MSIKKEYSGAVYTDDAKISEASVEQETGNINQPLVSCHNCTLSTCDLKPVISNDNTSIQCRISSANSSPGSFFIGNTCACSPDRFTDDIKSEPIDSSNYAMYVDDDSIGSNVPNKCNLPILEPQHSNADNRDKGLTDASNLTQHVMTNKTGKKTYSCPRCGMCFVRASGLKKHTIAHAGKGLYSCSHCSKSFANARSLQRTCVYSYW